MSSSHMLHLMFPFDKRETGGCGATGLTMENIYV